MAARLIAGSGRHDAVERKGEHRALPAGDAQPVRVRYRAHQQRAQVQVGRERIDDRHLVGHVVARVLEPDLIPQGLASGRVALRRAPSRYHLLIVGVEGVNNGLAFFRESGCGFAGGKADMAGLGNAVGRSAGTSTVALASWAGGPAG